MVLRVVPMGVREAQGFIQLHHSHHDAPRGGRFAVAVAEVEGGPDALPRIACVAMVGNPIARATAATRTTAELTRSASDGTRHAASKCIAAASHAALTVGYRRIISYTILGEAGASYRAAGWHVTGLTGDPNGSGKGWLNRPGRKVQQGAVKVRWEFGPDALPPDGAAALACGWALGGWTVDGAVVPGVSVAARAETLPLLARCA